MTKQADLVKRAGLFICAFLGIALQIQASIGIQTDYSGLRVNLGDIILPIAGLFILLTLVLKKSEMPQWNIPFGIFWPILLSGIITFSLFHGRVVLGEWSHWALLNKYIGWLVLMAYFGLGAWLVSNIGNLSAKAFLRFFIVFFLITTLAGMMVLLIIDVFPHIFPLIERQLRGLMGNRNAYAFVILIVISLLAIYKLTDVKALKGDQVSSCFWFFLPLILVYNASRIAFGATIILLLITLVWFGRKSFKPILLPVLLGSLIITSMFFINQNLVFREKQNIQMMRIVDAAKANELTFEEYSSRINDKTGDTVRLRVLSDALELWKQHPIMGAGLGTFLNYQKEKYSDSEKPVLDIIDTTPLWLLTETGLVGLSAFLAFYGLILWTCWKNRSPVKDDLDVLRVALLLILPGFAIMSLFHELLYARHLWFMLGMALAVPKKHPAG